MRADRDAELRGAGFTLARCQQIARQYRLGVVLGGGGAWDESQNDACQCCNPCDLEGECVRAVRPEPAT